MNTDDFEQQLQRQPLQPPPAAWRGEILAAARAELRPETPREASPLLIGWRALCARFPLAWGAVAALWLVIIGTNAFLAGPAVVMTGRNPDPSPSDWFMTWNLRNDQLRELTAELGNFPERVPAPPTTAPGPRSDRRRNDETSPLETIRSAGVPAGFACGSSIGTGEKFETRALLLSSQAAGTAALPENFA